MSALLETPLNDWHVNHGARMAAFGGWNMPILYSSIIQEHQATRQAVCLTDVSHMGRFVVDGPGAGEYLDSVLTRNIAALKPGQIRYSLLTDEQGRVLDDLLVGLFHRSTDGRPYYYIVVNASNREKDFVFLQNRLLARVAGEDGGNVRLIDETFERGMIAIQGPRSVELLQPFVAANLDSMKYYSGTETNLASGGRWAMITRTGYTGEDGFEIAIEPFFMEQFVDELCEAGKPLGLQPVGLGARDTLRLEAGMPLYGHELSEDISPFEAGLDYALYLDGPDFPGRDILRNLKKQPLLRTRVGLEILGKRPAREGSGLFLDGKKVGCVTSGTFSPTLGKPIAMGYVSPEFSEPGRSLSVDIRGTMTDAVIVSMPFYSRQK